MTNGKSLAKDNQKVIIKNLADYPEHVPLISKWLWQEFGKKHGRTLKETTYRTEHSLTKKCPQVLVAFYGNHPVGTVTLRGSDHPYRPDLSPWLGSLFVLKKYRNLRIGTYLQQALLKTAKKQKFKKIYLITELKNYYGKNGWKFLESSLYTNGKTIDIYKHTL